MITKNDLETQYRKGVITATEKEIKFLVLDGLISQQRANELYEVLVQEYAPREYTNELFARISKLAQEGLDAMVG